MHVQYQSLRCGLSTSKAAYHLVGRIKQLPMVKWTEAAFQNKPFGTESGQSGAAGNLVSATLAYHVAILLVQPYTVQNICAQIEFCQNNSGC